MNQIPLSERPAKAVDLLTVFPGLARLFLVSLLVWAAPLFAEPTISEFMAVSEVLDAEAGGILDADGEGADWIEIYNPDATAVSLNRYHLSDDKENLKKWQFPDVTLEAGGYLVVFASSKDRREANRELHTNFKLNRDGEYLALVKPDGVTILKKFDGFPSQLDGISYGFGSIGSVIGTTWVEPGGDAKWLVPGAELETDWRVPEFDDAAWSAGKSGIGFGFTELTGEGGDVKSAMKGINASVYIRFPIEIPEPAAVLSMTMKLKFEDGFIAYLNGNLIAAENAPSEEEVTFDATATQTRADDDARQYAPFEVNFAGLLRPGKNILAFQALNSSPRGSDLILSPDLSAELLDLTAPVRDGYFPLPTPGRANGMGSDSPPEMVAFSVATKTFTGTVTVSLSNSKPDATIRYTTDGSVPTQEVGGSSVDYADPILVDDTVRIRARAFLPDALPGPVSTEGYIKLDDTVAGFTSDLPIVILDNFGKGKPNNRQMFYTLIFEPKGPENRASVMNPPDLVTRAGARIRGTTSAGFPKYGLAYEAWDESDTDRDIAPLGMPAESDWVLNARYTWDRSLIRNPFIYAMSRQIGRWAPRSKFVEMFVNTNGGAVIRTGSTTTDDYFGVYAFMEKIKRGRDRVNVSAMSQGDNEEPEVTGGYMWKVDRVDPGDRGIRGIRDASDSMAWVYPKETLGGAPVLTQAQSDYLIGYFNEFVAAIKEDNFTNPQTGKHYTEYIDVGSWIDEHILRALAKDPDALRLSTFFHKQRGGKMKYGPIWDFDRTMGSEDGRDRNPTGWEGGTKWWTYPWWRELVWEPGRIPSGDPDFMQAYIDRWQSLRLKEFSAENMHSVIDSMAATIREAQERNFERWGSGARPNGGQFSDGDLSWQGEIVHLKGWLQARAEWIDTLFPARPALNQPGGVVPDGFKLSMSSLEGPIYYTVDGSDPRAPGGGVSESAILSPGGPVLTTLLPENSNVRFFVPTDDALGDTWTAAGFNDAGWQEGPAGIGFETANGTLEPAITTNIADQVLGVNASVYLRSEFTVENDIPNVINLTLKLQYDDGFVAYLNGREIARANAPDQAEWNSEATSSHSDSDAIQFEEFRIDEFADKLVTGRNVLAIQAMNQSAGGVDLLNHPVVEISEIKISEPLTLTGSVVVIARTMGNDFWSSPVKETFIMGGMVPASAGNIVVSEIMYRSPAASIEEDATGFSPGDFEFMEVLNIGSNAVGLAGISVGGGIEFDFAGGDVTFLLPGQRAVVVRNKEAFLMRYGKEVAERVAGEFGSDSSLSNAGEELRLTTTGGSSIRTFTYGVAAPWPVASSGDERFSIELASPANNPDHGNGANWVKSSVPSGSPGTGDPFSIPGGSSPDKDRDGLPFLLEYAFGSSDDDPSSGPGLTSVSIAGDGQPGFTYQKNLEATDVAFALEISTELESWSDATDRFEATGETPNGDGTAMVTFRWKEPIPEEGEIYIRLKVTQQ
jgi:hypothetical protein